MATAGAPDKDPQLETSHFRVSGMWWGALANAFLCCLALTLSRWLTQPLGDPKRVGFRFAIEEGRTSSLAERARPWIIGSVLLSILITLTGTLQRMDNGLWHGEDETARHFIVGRAIIVQRQPKQRRGSDAVGAHDPHVVAGVCIDRTDRDRL